MEKSGKTGQKKRKLTPKRERFCQEYILDFNGAAAARRVGYSEHTANRIASDLLSKVDIQARIMELQLAGAQEYNATKQRLIKILMDIAGATIEDITDPETGAILPVHQWPDHMKGTVVGSESDELYAGYGEDRQAIGIKRKIKFADKTKAVELLNKMLGFNMPDKVAQTTPEGEAAPPVIKIYVTPPKADDDV